MGKSHTMRRAGSANGGRMPFQNPFVTVCISKDGQTSKQVRVAVGSPLLRALAAKTWAEVTDGSGVVLVDGKEVPPGK